jgi:CubicO group peptidase (beta-lactamase class C family)
MRYFVVFSVVVAASLPAAIAEEIQKDVAVRIKRIERGLHVRAQGGEKEHTSTIAKEMKRLKIPGISIAVIENSEIAWTKEYGVVDASSNAPVTAESLFQAASISKPVTALAALHLVQEGKLSLDANINDALRSWKLPAHSAGYTATLRGLLSHTAGITVSGFPGLSSSAQLPTTLQILNGEPPAITKPIVIDVEPNTQFRYSGGGYTIIQQTLMDTMQKPFPDLLRELVLEPLEMQDSTFDHPLAAAFETRAVSAHDFDGGVVPGKWNVYAEQAAAGLWTTPTDLAKVAIEVQKTLAGAPGKVLSKEMLETMLTKQTGGRTGLGFFLEGEGDATRFMHTGGNRGFTCLLTASKSKGFGAVIMTNGAKGDVLYRELLTAIEEEYGWVK